MRLLIISTLLVIIASCVGHNDQSTLTINGTIDKRYNGLKLFLVPQPRPTADIVDSTFVKNGKFVFKKSADSVYVSHIVASRRANVPIERLLVVIEPGVLNVQLDSVSSSNGTPLNNRLQEWKEAIMESMKMNNPTKYEEVTVNLIKDNPNPLGGYIYGLYENMLSQPQKSMFDSLGIDKWKPKR